MAMMMTLVSTPVWAQQWAYAKDISTDPRAGLNYCLTEQGTPGKWTAAPASDADVSRCQTLVQIDPARATIQLLIPGVIESRSYSCAATSRFSGAHPCVSPFFSAQPDKPTEKRLDIRALAAAVDASGLIPMAQAASLGRPSQPVTAATAPATARLQQEEAPAARGLQRERPPATAARPVADAQDHRIARQHRVAAEAERQKRIKEERTREDPKWISVKTGEELKCVWRKEQVDANGKKRYFCDGEEVLQRLYVNPDLKRYATEGRGTAYMAAMGLPPTELTAKLKSIGLVPNQFMWSEPFKVDDVNKMAKPVYVVLGCRVNQYYCKDTFQYADAVFLVYRHDNVSLWFTNLESGMAQTCRLQNARLNCIRPKPKDGYLFNNVFALPYKNVNPLWAVTEQVKGNYEWAQLTDKQRSDEAIRIAESNERFFNGVKALLMHDGRANQKCDAACQQDELLNKRGENAMEWASKKPGRDPSMYQGN